MKRRRFSRPDRHRRFSKRALRFEMLHERAMLDGAGLGVADALPWFDPGALTYSFAPDQTMVAGEQNRLFEEMSALGSVTDWQNQFDAAFNAWLTPLGVSTREVPDSGSRFGVAGRTQGDIRFGDVRIAAIPLSQGVLATSVPHSAMVQGTWAGDILINSNATWNNLQEVFAVALHEFGHVLGLDHSSDPTSLMFSHGVNEATGPQDGDIQVLQQLYAGIRFEDEEDGDGADSGHSESDPTDGDDDPADLSTIPPSELVNAIDLTASVGTTLRYVAFSELIDGVAPLYKLQPSVAEVEGLENLTIALQSTGASHLNPRIVIYSEYGQEVQTRVLHDGQGNLIIQAYGLNSNNAYYVKVDATPGSPPDSQNGSFEIVMDYVPELLESHRIEQVTLNSDQPIAQQDFAVVSSRLVHLHVEFDGKPGSNDAAANPVVFVQMFDEENRVVTQIAVEKGQSHSAPLVFLPAGQYTLRYVAANGPSGVADSELSIYLDEVSLDVGPGVSNPNGQPYLNCGDPGANSEFCFGYTSIAPENLTYSTSGSPVSYTYPWWYGYGFTCNDYAPTDQQSPNIDPLWWKYFVSQCEVTPVDPPPVDPPPVDPPPVDPPPVDPPPVDPISAWQNQSLSSDVSGDNVVTSTDALIIINMLGKSNGASIAVGNAASQTYADVNGDFWVTARDALMVINSLAIQQVSAEAESLAAGNLVIAGTSKDDQEPVQDAAIAQLF